MVNEKNMGDLKVSTTSLLFSLVRRWNAYSLSSWILLILLLTAALIEYGRSDIIPVSDLAFSKTGSFLSLLVIYLHLRYSLLIPNWYFLRNQAIQIAYVSVLWLTAPHKLSVKIHHNIHPQTKPLDVSV